MLPFSLSLSLSLSHHLRIHGYFFQRSRVADKLKPASEGLVLGFVFHTRAHGITKPAGRDEKILLPFDTTYRPCSHAITRALFAAWHKPENRGPCFQFCGGVSISRSRLMDDGVGGVRMAKHGWKRRRMLHFLCFFLWFLSFLFSFLLWETRRNARKCIEKSRLDVG